VTNLVQGEANCFDSAYIVKIDNTAMLKAMAMIDGKVFMFHGRLEDLLRESKRTSRVF